MAELVAVRLAEFVAAQGSRMWEPGRVDCCLLLADWAIWLGHSDPANHLRGAYSDENGFRSIIAAHQGVIQLVAGCVTRIGGKPLLAPGCGSVGVIGSPNNIDRQWGAIFDGVSWIVRGRDGIGPIVARPLAVWEI